MKKRSHHRAAVDDPEVGAQLPPARNIAGAVMQAKCPPMKIPKDARPIFFQKASETGEVMVINACPGHISQAPALFDHLNDWNDIVTNGGGIALVRLANSKSLCPGNERKPLHVELVNDVTPLICEKGVSTREMVGMGSVAKDKPGEWIDVQFAKVDIDGAIRRCGHHFRVDTDDVWIVKKRRDHLLDPLWMGAAVIRRHHKDKGPG